MAANVSFQLDGKTRQRVVAAGVVTAMLCLAGCSGGGDADSKVAQARVTAKQKAVSDAEAEATAARTAFCAATKDYILGIDRYGDVLNASAPTVGDVKDAGSELAEPREDTFDAGQAAVTAQRELETARQELAEAEAALSAGSASGDATTPEKTSTKTKASGAPTTPAAEVPTATVDRVKQAESDFESAQAGITDKTPLKQASQQFNAAAVALEMSWLRLFSEAGCLDDQQKEAEAAVHDYAIALQDELKTAGYYKGDVDGVYGDATVAAVEALQKAHGLPVTGTVDKATAAALRSDLEAKGGAAAEQALASTAAVQQTLKLAGFWDGPVDGVWTSALTDAVKSFQTQLGVEPTGEVDAATITALEKAIEAARQAVSSPSPTSSPSRTG
jgi:murein L,D-transpeptidase YcbB/YkuD